jgi:hypothetical protein
MAIIISLITLLGLGILRQRQMRFIGDAAKREPDAKPGLHYSFSLRQIQSGGTWFFAFCVASCALWFMGIWPERRNPPPLEDLNLAIGIILFTAGALGSLAEYSLFKLVGSIPNVKIDLIRYRKEAIYAQVLKWLFVISLVYCWITIISITFTRQE